MQNLRAILEEAGSGLDRLVKTTVFLQDLGDFAAMNEVYAATSATPPARAPRSRSRSSRRARSSRSRRSRCSDAFISSVHFLAHNGGVWNSVADYVHSLGLDAYLVGGAVRDELLGRTPPELDFVVPGVGHAELREALEPHGQVEDLVVADQRVGVRLLPRDKAARALSPPGSSSRRPASSARRGRAGTTSRSSPTAGSRSSRTWSGATSRSTRSPGGSRPGRSSTRSAAATTSSAGSCARPADELPRRPAPDRPRPPLRLAARRRAGRGHAAPDARGRRGSSTSRASGSAAALAADGMGELSKLLLGARRRRR